MWSDFFALFDWPGLVGAAVAFGAALLIVLTKQFHGHISMDSLVGVQKFHTAPTPRIGGVSIFLGLIAVLLTSTEERVNELLAPLLIAGVPAFLFGLMEDFTKQVGVQVRLLATMSSGLLGWFITGYSITDVNVYGLDNLLAITALSVVFTAFSVGGIANAINIIDGFNGLSGGAVMISLVGLAAIGLQAADTPTAQLCIVLLMVTFGFFAVNWPFGKIFLGDGGAYFLGFGLAWIAVLILARNPEVSAWGPLLACGYPVLEVGFSVYRRRRRNLSPGDPDRLHLHSLVKRRVVRRLLLNTGNTARNSITGAIMWFAALLPVVAASLFWRNTPALAVSTLACVFLYSAIYARLTQFRWCITAATTKKFAAAKA